MKKLVSVTFALICIFMLLPMAVFAINSGPCSLTVVMEHEDKPIGGMKIAVCRAADAREESAGVVYFDAAPSFAGAGADFTDLDKAENIALALSLDAYASANGIARDVNTTGSDGRVTFTGLPAGLYLVAQADDDNSEYVIAPYLVLVPVMNERTRGWGYNVTAYPKTQPVRRGIETIPVSVYKVWTGSGSHPNSISVQLYQNGNPYGDPITLSSETFWWYTWDNLNPADTWTADEIDVPSGYTKTVSGTAATGFVITNTKKPDIPDNPTTPKYPPDGPKTDDTNNAQLWIMLIGIGIAGLFIVICAANAKRIARAFKKK